MLEQMDILDELPVSTITTFAMTLQEYING